MSSKIASIERIKDIKDHPNADSLDLVTILGWQVISKKGEHSIGDLVVYINTDTVVPEHEEFEFLRNKKFKIKPIKLRGEISNGLILPLKTIHKFDESVDLNSLQEGDDVSKILNVVHYEKPVSVNLTGQVKRATLPSFLRKTDEENIKNYPQLIDELNEDHFVISTKLDGSSITIYHRDGEVGVCSRRMELKENDDNVFWQVAKKYGLPDKLKSLNKNIALQGECVGPKIQGNPLGLKEPDVYFFDVWDIDNQQYLSHNELITYAQELGFNIVPTVYDSSFAEAFEGGKQFDLTIENLQNLANETTYSNSNYAEGLVIRSIESKNSEVLHGSRLSAKIISENYKES